MRNAAPIALWMTGAVLFLALMAERASTPVLSREQFVSVLAECGASGRPVEDTVRAMGLSERAWGRTVSLHAADPATANLLQQRIAALPAEKPDVGN